MKCKDHKGNEFTTFYAMCAYWEQNPDTVKRRLNRGYTLEYALTATTPKLPEYIVPETGTRLVGSRAIAAYYGIADGTLRRHIRKDKMSIRRAILVGLRNKDRRIRGAEVVDHLGRHFKNLKFMAEAWHINYQTLYGRLYIQELDIKLALTLPVKRTGRSNKRLQEELKNER